MVDGGPGVGGQGRHGVGPYKCTVGVIGESGLGEQGRHEVGPYEGRVI
jgi:hypothetical protein